MIPYPVGDMLTRIRNANHRFHPTVTMPHSKLKEAIARILEEEGFIAGYEVIEDDPQPRLTLRLKYKGTRSQAKRAITEIRLVSKPSRRVYVDALAGEAGDNRDPARQQAEPPGVCGEGRDSRSIGGDGDLHPLHFARGAVGEGSEGARGRR